MTTLILINFALLAWAALHMADPEDELIANTHRRMIMARYLVYAHDQGEVEFVADYETSKEAHAAIKAIERDIAAHPTWYDDACTWFEVVVGHAPEAGVPVDCWDAAF